MFFFEIVDHGIVVDLVVCRMVNELVRFLLEKGLLVEHVALKAPIWWQI